MKYFISSPGTAVIINAVAWQVVDIDSMQNLSISALLCPDFKLV